MSDTEEGHRRHRQHADSPKASEHCTPPRFSSPNSTTKPVFELPGDDRFPAQVELPWTSCLDFHAWPTPPKPKSLPACQTLADEDLFVHVAHPKPALPRNSYRRLDDYADCDEQRCLKKPPQTKTASKATESLTTPQSSEQDKPCYKFLPKPTLPSGPPLVPLPDLPPGARPFKPGGVADRVARYKLVIFHLLTSEAKSLSKQDQTSHANHLQKAAWLMAVSPGAMEKDSKQAFDVLKCDSGSLGMIGLAV